MPGQGVQGAVQDGQTTPGVVLAQVSVQVCFSGLPPIGAKDADGSGELLRWGHWYWLLPPCATGNGFVSSWAVAAVVGTVMLHASGGFLLSYGFETG